MEHCPVCQNIYTVAKIGNGADGWGYRIDCPICGRFDLVREAYDDYLDPQSTEGSKLTAANRARIAHKLRTGISTGPAGLPRLTSEFLSRYIQDGCPGPLRGEQATNAIRFIGDQVLKTGCPIDHFPPGFFAIIGAPNPRSAGELEFELLDRKLVTGTKQQLLSGPPEVLHTNLTLDGWEIYENEKKGKIAGSYGFFALKFGDPELDALAKNVIKPGLKQKLHFDLVDMRDVARAGVIDNIMRTQIRDSAFIIVDLTHDNAGAYWEAGYAEGLGKPVIYICNKEKFEAVQTHFDTNHCTTVPWSSEKPEDFVQELVATLRRSLNLF